MKLKIVKCNDPLKWYAKLVGKEVPLLAIEKIEYKSREPAGYINFVLKSDAEIVGDIDIQINTIKEEVNVYKDKMKLSTVDIECMFPYHTVHDAITILQDEDHPEHKSMMETLQNSKFKVKETSSLKSKLVETKVHVN